MSTKPRADFQYRLATVDKQPLLLIWDLDRGNRSLTNDIENVVAEIAWRHYFDPSVFVILYRDSEKKWDGWDWHHRQFYPFPVRWEFQRRVAEQNNFDFSNPIASV